VLLAAEWNHVAASLSADGSVRLFVNGEEVAAGFASLVIYGTDPVAVFAGAGLIGSLDELMFFDRGIDETDAATLYRHGLRGGACPTAPIAVNDEASTDAGVAVSIDFGANDSDEDGDDLSFELVTPPAHGTLSGDFATGVVLYTPDAGFAGNDSFEYLATDGVFETAPATVSITVRQVNRPPVVQGESYSVRAGRSLTILFSALLSNDSDPDAARYQSAR
jgi:hypothetical protein